MRLRVAIAFGFLMVSDAALAEPYSFYSPVSTESVGYRINYIRSASPQAACYSAPTFNNKPDDKRIVASDWDLASSACRIIQEDEKEFLITFLSGSDACPGDDVFNYAQQTCGAVVPDSLDEYSENILAVNLATMAFVSLGLGMLVGLRMGA